MAPQPVAQVFEEFAQIYMRVFTSGSRCWRGDSKKVTQCEERRDVAVGRAAFWYPPLAAAAFADSRWSAAPIFSLQAQINGAGADCPEPHMAAPVWPAPVDRIASSDDMSAHMVQARSAAW